MVTFDPIGDILLFAAPLGIAAVFVVALCERIVPLLPSPGLFAAIGFAAAEGLWCLPAAIVASVLGSGTGAFAAYRVGVGLASGKKQTMRIQRLLRRRDRLGGYLRRARRTGEALPFIAQLVPAARIVAPLLAGAMGRDRRRLAFATLAGLTIWNATFIGTGYAMMRLGSQTNVSAAGVKILALVGCVLILTQLVGRWRTAAARELRVSR